MKLRFEVELGSETIGTKNWEEIPEVENLYEFERELIYAAIFDAKWIPDTHETTYSTLEYVGGFKIVYFEMLGKKYLYVEFVPEAGFLRSF